MDTRRSALAPRADALAPVDLVVVSTGCDVPGWVREWGVRSGRPVQVRACPDTPVERIRTVTGLAGRSVLLTRGPLARSGSRLVVAAVRDLPDDAPVVTQAAAAAAHLDAVLLLVHGVPLSFAERSVGMDEALDHGRWVLETAADRLAPDVAVHPQLLRVHPHELVGEEVEADLLVVGGPRARVRRLGLVASSAVHHALCPVLLVPRPLAPAGFDAADTAPFEVVPPVPATTTGPVTGGRR